MGTSENKQVARKYYEAFNTRDLEFERATLTEDVVMVSMGSGEHFEGPDAVVSVDRTWLTAFPDGRVEVDHIIAEGDNIVIEFTGSGTHTGPLQSPDGDIPATGRPARVGFCDVVTFRDGKISAIRSYYDTLSLMAQLGLVPESAASR